MHPNCRLMVPLAFLVVSNLADSASAQPNADSSKLNIVIGNYSQSVSNSVLPISAGNQYARLELGRLSLDSKVHSTSGGTSLLADGSQSSAGTPAQTSGAAETVTSPSLQGSVKGTTVDTKTGLKDLGELTHHVKQTLNCLLYEAQRQDTVSVAPGDIIGNIVMPTLPSPSGAVALGDALPPRKKWVDFWMGHLQILIPEIQREVSATIIPTEKSEKLKSEWQNAQTEVQSIVSDYERLQKDTTGPKYSNNDIAQDCSVMYKKIEEFEKARKEIWRQAKDLEKSKN